MRVLVVDDSEIDRGIIVQRGGLAEGYEVTEAQNVQEAWRLYEPDPFPMVITDWSMEGSVSGIELVRRVKSIKSLPYSYVILVTGVYKEGRIEGLNSGADAFVTKPVEKDALRERIAAARRILEAFDQVRDLRGQVRHACHTDEILKKSNSKAFEQMLALADRAALTDVTVLLLGETGTGKEVMARRIHESSSRKDGPFVAVNCSAIPDNLVESELFGHVKGAFTGADRSKPGKFEDAGGGTIFLDEIGDLPLQQQPKLLRVLENKICEHVGGNKPIKLNARIIAATNYDLSEKIKAGKFRGDLFHRINTVPITLCPLRDRREDILPLAQKFLERFVRGFHRNDIKGISKEAEAFLLSYHWPGNIRELISLLQYTVIVADGPEILPDHLLSKLSLGRPVPPSTPLEESTPIDLDAAVKDFKREKLCWALRLANNKRKEAGRLLGAKTPDDVRHLIKTLLPETEGPPAE